MMAETSHSPSDKFEKALVTEKTVKVSKQPVYLERNLLLHLAELPFGTRNGDCGITLESGSGTLAINRRQSDTTFGTASSITLQEIAQ